MDRIMPWLNSIPAFKAVSDREGVLGPLVDFLRRGAQAFSTRDDGKTVIFLGFDNKLYELREQAASTQEGEGSANPKEINQGRQPWQLKEGVNDLSGVSVCSTREETFLLDTDMQFFHLSQAGLTRCLTEHHVGQVACGHAHVAVVTTNGLVFASGYNAHGQLGLGHSNAVAIPDMQPMQLPKSQFYTYVACGYYPTVVLCENRTAYGCGHLGGTNYTTPLELKSPAGLGPFVKVACGNLHAVFLTAAGRLAGCGGNHAKELLSLGNSVQPQEIPFDEEKGRLVDIFCHPDLHASVVLTSENEFYVCGRVGSLFGLEQDFPKFQHCDRSAVIIDGKTICTKPPSGCVRIPEFDNPEKCDIQLRSNTESGSAASEAADEANMEQAKKILPRLPKGTLVQLVEHGLEEGLSPRNVLHHRQHQIVQEQDAATPADVQVETSVHIGFDTVRSRSPFLWRLINTDMQDVQKQGKRKHSIALRGYSPATLRAYGQFLHEDRVAAETKVAVELLELAREYCDDNGLAAQCASLVKHQISAKELPACLQKCIDLQQTALGVELVRRQLCLDNSCEVLQVAQTGRQDCPYADYIRNMAMAFAVAHASAVVESGRFDIMDDAIKAQLLKKLVEMKKVTC